jgi:hypothetical protein
MSNLLTIHLRIIPIFDLFLRFFLPLLRTFLYSTYCYLLYYLQKIHDYFRLVPRIYLSILFQLLVFDFSMLQKHTIINPKQFTFLFVLIQSQIVLVRSVNINNRYIFILFFITFHLQLNKP